MPGQLNALAGETSPYLLQHANNPVHWHPWREDALLEARARDVPILLSIGYSACHWCHVMAHESFEDEGTAALMNAGFVNIKVDREERPDIDKIYQLAHQLLTRRSGGWPLTVFLSPDDQRPFFAGTYFPSSPRGGMTTFRDLLIRIGQYFVEERAALDQQNGRLMAALDALPREQGEGVVELSDAPLLLARDRLRANFDVTNGGFGSAPKFPHPTNLDLLLRRYATTAMDDDGDEEALAMALMTLLKMGNGGMNDQLAGGFCRYSVDDLWMIPHFEKMLYDNGPLLSVYADAYQITQHPELRRFSLETACWVMRDMQSSDGGFYSSFDADSEGEEGKFYVWDKEEVQGLLNAQEFAVLGSHFGLDRAPNFEGARWNLHVFEALDTSEGNGALSRRTLDAARAKLLTARNRRIAPNRDDKVLVSWNALMVKGLVKAGVVLQQPDFIDSAERALEFIRQQMWQDGRLLATYKDGRAHLNAYLDDYAFMLDALLEALAARWNPNFLVFALSLADALLDYFEDQENGGFYFTSSDHERLILRPKSLMDEATPSGAAVAAVALQRLGHLVGDIRYLQAAERTVRVAWSPLNEYPHAHGVMLQALEELLLPTETIVLRGEAHELGQWHKCAMACYAPGRQVVAIPGSGTPLPGLLASRTAAESGVVAYICAGHHCDAPITDFATFERRIGTTQLEPQRVEVVAR